MKADGSSHDVQPAENASEGTKRPSSSDLVLTPEKKEGDEPKITPSKGRKRFWQRNKSNKDTDLEKTSGNSEQLPPVPFLQLFRFTTPFEKVLNLVGLGCAVAVGVTQPLLSLVFGNFAKEFVSFGSNLLALQEGRMSEEEVEISRQYFKDVASSDALKLVYIGIAMFVCTALGMYIWVYTSEVNAKRVRELYLKAILHQEIAFFDNVGAGEVATRIQSDTHLVQTGMSEKVVLATMYLSAFVSCFILAYIRQWQLALALTSVVPCAAVSAALMNGFVSKYMLQSLGHIADGGSIAEEVISSIRTAHAFGTQDVLSKLFDDRVVKSRTIDLKAAISHGVGLGFFFFIVYSAYALAFQFGTTLIIRGVADVSKIVSVITAILIGTSFLALVGPDLNAITHGRAAAAKLFATIDRVPSIDSSDPSGLKPDQVTGEITLEHVSFNYPSRPDVRVVEDLSITFPAGKTCALVGASGSGKSTVVALIERFYDPLVGSVKLDGVDLRQLNLKWLRRQVGLVSQEPVLFATTIKGNVAHGLIGTEWDGASEEEKDRLIVEACKKANAHGFVSRLPLGYDTVVGERGFLLSGGQKQRIAIARAIVSNPRILLLDEATSALDTQSEGIVQDALDKAAAGRTTITIAHRLSTIKGSDCIFVMGGGRVLQKGTHEELLSDVDGPYSRLVQAQKLREANEHWTPEEQEEQEKLGQSSQPEYDEKASLESLERPISAGEKMLGEDNRPSLGRVGTMLSVVSNASRRRGGSVAGKSGEKKKPYGMFYLFRRLGTIQKEVWNKYALGFVFALLTGMIYPSFGVVYATSLTTFQNTQDNRRLRHEGDRNALWFFVIAVISVCTIAMQNYTFAAAAAHLTYKLRTLTFRSILRQDIEFFDEEKNSTGSITAKLSDNPQKVNGLAGITLGAIVQSTATITTGCVVGLAFQWRLALVGIACLPFLVSAGYIRLRVVVLKDEQNKAAHENASHLACEAAGAIRTVASLTREDDCCNVYSKSLEEPLRRSKRVAIYANMLFGFSQAAMFWVFALVFWYGAQGLADERYGTTAFFVTMFCIIFGSMQAGNIFSYVPDMSSAKGAAADIVDLLDSKPRVDTESSEGTVLHDVRGQITVSDVHFRYPTRPGVQVLKGLDLKVEPGTYVALVGESGCGKSTIIQLIERFYDPTFGKVLLDGNDISTLNVKEYRKHIALVSQEPTLYSGSIRFNVLLGASKPHSEVTQEEIEAACRDANILDFIKQLPQGFDTEVGGKGSQLSGGQKQRVAIARALLRNPKVLLLDEATSALDSGSEKVVQQALDQAAKGRTTIAIAHSLSTIQNADRIYFVKDGKISESGTHEELVALRGGYYEYVQLQALSRR